MIKTVTVDDIQILGQGLRVILEQDKDIQAAGLAADDWEAWQLYRKYKPDVVLMDMRMPKYDGSYGITRIKEDYPDIKVSVLTTSNDRETVDAAVESGVDGYILREMEDDKVIQSVKAVCAGMRVFGRNVFKRMRRQMAPGKIEVDVAGDLTPRERDIIRLVARGMDNREIAGALFLVEGTVRNNIPRLLEKLKPKDRTQLAILAVKHNLDE